MSRGLKFTDVILPPRKSPKGRRKITTIYDKVDTVYFSNISLFSVNHFSSDGEEEKLLRSPLVPFSGARNESLMCVVPPLSPPKGCFQFHIKRRRCWCFFIEDKNTPGFNFFSYFYRKHHDFVRYWSRIISMHLVFETIIPGSTQEGT